MEYDEEIYTEFALRVLEHDIRFWCSRYYVPGYDQEDLEQECRLKLWQQISKFNPKQGVLVRTWAQNVIKNTLKDLLKRQTRQKRGAGQTELSLDLLNGTISVEFSSELDEILDELSKKGKKIEDCM